MSNLVDYRDQAPPSWPPSRCTHQQNHRFRSRPDYVDWQADVSDEANSEGVAANPEQLVLRLELAASQDSDEAIDLLYGEIDQLLRDGDFHVVDRILRAILVERFSVLLLLAFASITSAAREHLASRGDFITRLRRRLEATDPSRVEELLAGLE